MTDVLRIAHLRIAHQGAILRWAILRVILEFEHTHFTTERPLTRGMVLNKSRCNSITEITGVELLMAN